MVKVVCVLKSGGDYDWEYVSRLCRGVKEHLTLKHEFFCVTDMPNKYSFIRQVPLEKGWGGSWAKIEVFRAKGEVLYLDLDTVLSGNIDHIINDMSSLMASALSKDLFFMLEAFKKDEEWASGVMYWGWRYELAIQ